MFSCTEWGEAQRHALRRQFSEIQVFVSLRSKESRAQLHHNKKSRRQRKAGIPKENILLVLVRTVHRLFWQRCDRGSDVSVLQAIDLATLGWTFGSQVFALHHGARQHGTFAFEAFFVLWLVEGLKRLANLTFRQKLWDRPRQIERR